MPSTKIIVRNDGPLRVEGEIELVDMQGQPYGLAGRTAIALCRCGHSANKPFCDGSHKAAGFQDQQQLGSFPTKTSSLTTLPGNDFWFASKLCEQLTASSK